jgi:ubiquinone/menaquinone biosynthesis C-methylase UbiE/DNA-binding transcriptional ArsR family regulator
MDSAALFRLLGDDARLRILRLLDAERLNVTELTSILGIAQSGVSRHLGLLKDAGLVEERRDAGFTYFRLAPGLATGANGFGPVWPLLQAHFESAAASPAGRADGARLEEVRRVRKENFEDHGAEGERGQIVPGRSWAAWARALGHLLPPLVVADLGCGDGYLTVEASRFAKRVIAIDHSEAALARARDMAKRLTRRSDGDGTRADRSPGDLSAGASAKAEGGNVEWKRGELEDLPLDDDSVDVALLSQALHHAASPARALAEAARIVKPGGRVLVLELRAHQEAWVRERLGDTWLGFEDHELKRLLRDAGLTGIKLTVGARRARDPFTVLIASGVKPLNTAASVKRTSRNAR